MRDGPLRAAATPSAGRLFFLGPCAGAIAAAHESKMKKRVVAPGCGDDPPLSMEQPKGKSSV